MNDEQRKKKNDEHLKLMRGLSYEEVIINEVALCCLPETGNPYDDLQAVIQWHIAIAEFFKDHSASPDDEIDINDLFKEDN